MSTLLTPAEIKAIIRAQPAYVHEAAVERIYDFARAIEDAVLAKAATKAPSAVVEAPSDEKTIGPNDPRYLKEVNERLSSMLTASEQRTARLREALTEVRVYFAEREDVVDSSDGPRANDAMRWVRAIDDVLAESATTGKEPGDEAKP